jgi:cyclopropane fatty-acyl-phospholipid synthase-like methyltransferase
MAGPAPDWWRTGFGPSYLAIYDAYLAERTPAEIDQLEALLKIKPPLRILDLPCGQGRHSIELARRGYEVTGVDLSPYLLDIARERGEAAAVAVHERGLRPETVLVRRSSLEDVFLRLTGRSLVD